MTETISLNGSWLFKSFLGEDWLWRQAHLPGAHDLRGWHPARVPGSVQHDLWQNGLVPDPYFERNSFLLEWAQQRTWLYKKSFTIGEEHRDRRICLHFEGIDYAAQFYLNGERLGDHVGMYTPVDMEVDGRLQFGQENLLVVVIEPAPNEQPQVGRTSRVQTHKARMNYGWDFCPRMVHLGIWDAVRLEISGPVKIENVFVRPELAEDHQAAEVFVSAAVSCLQETDMQVEASLHFQGHVLETQHTSPTVRVGQREVSFRFDLHHPRLWWPNGHGDQPLYEIEIQARRLDGDLSDWRLVTFGIRRIRLMPNDGASPEALPYLLEVNGKRIYIKGWNWVPMDVLYGVERPEKLRRLLDLARRAHTNLLRVWGGGLIEKDNFYELCDRLGLLVWQEFIQSSSGIDNRPNEDPRFIAWMVRQAEQIVPRKRNHPALALWCGGNELQDVHGRPLGDEHPLLGALHAVVRRLDPGRAWLPTSPSGPVFGFSLEQTARDPLSLHDVHGPWEYQGLGKQQELYNHGRSLLHSEFGVESLTNRKTLEQVISPAHRLPVSLDNPYWEHLGAWWMKEAVWRAAFGVIAGIEQHVQATQFLQASGLQYALEADRRRKYGNSGTLPWQFNEPYPMAACTSAIDYYAQPKPAYYAVMHAYEPIHISAIFATQAWQGQADFEAEIWLSHSHSRSIFGAALETKLVGASGRVYAAQAQAADLPGNASTRLAEVHWSLANLAEQVFFLDLQLNGPHGQALSHNRYAFSLWEDLSPLLRLPATSLEYQVLEKRTYWEITLANPGEQVALFTWLEDARAPGSAGYVFFSANYFSLFPNESRTLMVEWSGIPASGRALSISAWNAPLQLIHAG